MPLFSFLSSKSSNKCNDNDRLQYEGKRVTRDDFIITDITCVEPGQYSGMYADIKDGKIGEKTKKNYTKQEIDNLLNNIDFVCDNLHPDVQVGNIYEDDTHLYKIKSCFKDKEERKYEVSKQAKQQVPDSEDNEELIQMNYDQIKSLTFKSKNGGKRRKSLRKKQKKRNTRRCRR